MSVVTFPRLTNRLTELDVDPRQVFRAYPYGTCHISSPAQCSSKPGCEPVAAGASAMGSIRLASSAFPGLLTRFDTGHIRRVSSGADLRSSVPALPDSHGPICSASRIQGILS